MKARKITNADGTKIELTVDRGVSRVLMVTGFVDHKSPDGRGAKTLYVAGRFYDLPNGMAALLIDDGTAKLANSSNEVVEVEDDAAKVEIVEDLIPPGPRSVPEPEAAVHDAPTFDDPPEE